MINLDNIYIILIGTHYAGNIGSCARAMLNMGLKNMILVKPNCQFTEETYYMARGASFIFENAPIYESFEEMKDQFNLLIGTSRRGAFRLHMRTSPRSMAEEMDRHYKNCKIGILFGDEKAGLSNQHLEHCAWFVRIPSNAEYESLNLSQAVMVICYELFLTTLEGEEEFQERKKDPQYDPRRDPIIDLKKEVARQEDVFALINHVRLFMDKVGFPNRGSKERVNADMKRLISSADIKRTDINLAHGFLRYLEEKFMGGRLEEGISPLPIEEERENHNAEPIPLPIEEERENHNAEPIPLPIEEERENHNR